MSQPNLDPTEFWETDFDEGHPDGALYPSVPLLTLHASPVTLESEWGETLVYLPTLQGAGILFRKFSDVTWFFPLVAADGFSGEEVFRWLLEQVRDGNVSGFWEVPPLDEVPSPLSEPALIYLCRPTVAKHALVEELDAKPVAKLSEAALEDLDEAVARALRR
jgi:hypothetical protein